MKTYRKTKIMELLQDGKILVYDTINTRTWITDENGVRLSAVWFNTYLEIMNSLTKIDTTFTIDYYKLAKAE